MKPFIKYGLLAAAIMFVFTVVADHYGEGYVIISFGDPPYNTSVQITTPEDGEVEVTVTYPLDEEVGSQKGTVR